MGYFQTITPHPIDIMAVTIAIGSFILAIIFVIKFIKSDSKNNIKLINSSGVNKQLKNIQEILNKDNLTATEKFFKTAVSKYATYISKIDDKDCQEDAMKLLIDIVDKNKAKIQQIPTKGKKQN